MEHLVKRNGHNEKYDERKVYGSVFAACKTLRMTDEEAELIAGMVSHETTEEFKNVKAVNAHTIHKFVASNMKKYHPDAAYMYDTHRDIS
jgi:transcriptional regulator NrdR family protein